MALSASLCSAVFLLSLFLLLSLPLSCTSESQREEELLSPSMVPEPYNNTSATDANFTKRCSDVVECKPGIILPVWKPQNPGLGDKVARTAVYFVSLMYLFLGVSIIADRFMASIEVITSQVRQ